MKIDNIKLVIWFIDDHAHRGNIHKPLETCINNYAAGLADGKPVVISSLVPPQLTMGVRPELAAALCWLKTFTLPEGTKLAGTHNRNAEILVYGISNWDAVKGYLGVEVEGGLKGRPFWPHLVITDVFNGELKTITVPNDIKSLDGYKFAKQFCVPRQIPSIVISSEKTAIEGLGPEWGGDKDLYFFRREQLTQGTEVLRTLQKLSPSLFRRWWIPEFSLAVEGHKNVNTSTYQVTFTKDGKIVSVKDVPPVPYVFLYLCAYGSTLARLKNWDKELVGWHESRCIAVSLPPTSKSSDSIIQLLPTMMELFERKYWEKNKDEIFFGGDNSRTRTTNVLNTNIIHLDVPYDLSLPKFWNNDLAKGNLITSMKEILTPEGMGWLAACCSRP